MLSFTRRKALLFFVVLVAVSGLAAGLLAGAPTGIVEPVFAAVCRSPNSPACPILSPFRTAAVDVDHYASAYTKPVEPDDGETWNITAYWNTAPPPPCTETTQTANAEVSWNGSSWVLSGVTLTADIDAISICNSGDTCSDGGTVHDHDYRLIARVNDPHTTGGGNLRQIRFATTSVDDGYVLDADSCELGDSVSPTSQTFSALQSGPGTCGFSCSNSGTSVTIAYE